MSKCCFLNFSGIYNNSGENGTLWVVTVLFAKLFFKNVSVAHIIKLSEFTQEVINIKKVCKLCGKKFETIKHGEKREYCFECSPPNTSNSITIIRKKAKQLGIEKRGGKCRKCGETRFYVLDFHHINTDEKSSELSDLAKGYDLDKFFKEIEKCDLLCSNCHREFHYLHTFFNVSYQDFLDNNY